jgi:predicted nucleotidyltransferase
MPETAAIPARCVSNPSHEQFVPAVRQWAAQWPQINRVFLFGSYVKRSKPAPSDLDMAIELTEECWAGGDLFSFWFFVKSELTESVSQRISARPDVQLYDPLMMPNVAGYVAEHGVLVYEKE